MFKKFMTFVTVAVAALSLASCEKEGGKETPVLDLFSASFGVLVNNVPHRRVRGRLFV